MRRGPEQRLDELGAARPDQSADAQDLAAPDGEADVLDLGRRAPGVDLQDCLAEGDLPLGEDVAELAAHHHGDEPLLAQGGRVVGADELPVAQDSDPVGDLEDLVHLVRDVDNADARGGEPAYLLEEAADVVLGDGGGGLVHHDDAGVL